MKHWKRLVFVIIILAGITGIIINNRQIILQRRSQNVVQTVIPVVTSLVQWDTLQNELELVGTVTPNNYVQVAAETGGKVVRCNIDVGRYVREGEELYVLDDELQKAQLLTAQANYERAYNDSIRYQFLKESQSIPDAQWDQVLLQYRLAKSQLIQAERTYNNTRIKAPISGVITTKLVDVGTMVNLGTIVCEIIDVSRLKVILPVAERDIAELQVGGSVEVRCDALHGKIFAGRIHAISPKASDAHTFPVEVSITDPVRELMAGMFVRIKFEHLKPAMGLVIPRNAILGSIQRPQVYVIDTVSMTAHVRNIRCGVERKGLVIVYEGLSAGEQVVVIGTNVLTDGAKVQISNRRDPL